MANRTINVRADNGRVKVSFNVKMKIDIDKISALSSPDREKSEMINLIHDALRRKYSVDEIIII